MHPAPPRKLYTYRNPVRSPTAATPLPFHLSLSRQKSVHYPCRPISLARKKPRPPTKSNCNSKTSYLLRLRPVYGDTRHQNRGGLLVVAPYKRPKVVRVAVPAPAHRGRPQAVPSAGLLVLGHELESVGGGGDKHKKCENRGRISAREREGVTGEGTGGMESAQTGFGGVDV